MGLILASTSPYRRDLLERLGLPFRVVAPAVNEDELKRAALPPRELAAFLAQAKAESVAASDPADVILGGDQLVEFAGQVLGKPGGVDEACAQLQTLQGQTHRLITAVCLVTPAGGQIHVDVTELTMRRLTPAEIARYVEGDHPLDCAGAYRIESRGIALFERIESADFTAIVGLPLIALTTLLRNLGFAIP